MKLGRDDEYIWYVDALADGNGVDIVGDVWFRGGWASAVFCSGQRADSTLLTWRYYGIWIEPFSC